ncbi:MAG: hypothetical protein Q9225_005416 [Loekoesia sp. 1 TL-2023]
MSDADTPPPAIDSPPIHDLDRRRVDALKVALSLLATKTTTSLLRNQDAHFSLQANYAGLILWILALFSSKCAAIVFMSRFAQPGRHKKEILSLQVIVTLFGLASLLALVVDCRVVSTIFYWDSPSHQNYCPNSYQRWQVITAFDAITEILMLAVPIDLIWSLQMRSKRKVGIITAFYIRLPVLALTLARNHYVHKLLDDPDTGLVARITVIWQEAELAYSIAAATLMCLKPLVRDFNTSFGLGGEMVRTYAATSYIASNNNGSQGLESKIGRLRGYGRGSRYGKGSVVEMDSRGGDFTSGDKSHTYVTERRVDERPNLGSHPDSTMSTTVSHDPDHRPHDSTGSRVPDDIVVTHRVEQSVHPRHMV